MINFWQLKRKLPTTLDELTDPLSGMIVSKDPKTGESYQYQVMGTLGFKLCATFSKPTYKDGRTYPLEMPPVAIKGESNWDHGSGVNCFARTIDPELYPPVSSTRAVPIR